MFWIYPHTIFRAFKEIYIMTYQFEGTWLSSYFRFFDIPITKMNVEKESGTKYVLCPYSSETDKELRKGVADLIKVIDKDDYNKIGERKRSSLSKNWYDNARPADIRTIKTCFDTVRRNYLKSPAKDLMWTVFKTERHKVKVKGSTWTIPEGEAKNIAKEKYGIAGGEELERFLKKYQCFVPVNAIATNDFADRTKLAYFCNIYPNPEIQKFFRVRGCEMDARLYATNTLIQWIWRSAIRNGKPITLYMPSVRMRELLNQWLGGD